jgi:hypothetical protein
MTTLLESQIYHPRRPIWSHGGWRNKAREAQRAVASEGIAAGETSCCNFETGIVPPSDGTLSDCIAASPIPPMKASAFTYVMFMSFLRRF